MSKIALLPPLVAERIAAGEVIERPASVVKELVENALDAGATEVSVALEAGGKRLIEVTDNGHGMDAADLALSVRRHATSKIRALEDLDRLATLGFRGEALPSVAAVSDLSIVSRANAPEADATPDAFEFRGDGVKAVTFGHFLGSSHGTRVRAEGLFSQVPARLKFLRGQGAEVAAVRECLERLAFARPDVGFLLTSDGRTILKLRPQPESDRVRALLADGNDHPLVTAETGVNAPYGIRARAYWVQGLSASQTRRIVQVLNGRVLRDRLIQQAMLAPFRQALLPGQFPAVALYLEASPAEFDVNVHPTKAEVRFAEPRKFFLAVESLVSGMIARAGAPVHVAGFAWAASAPAGVPTSEPACAESARADAPTPWNPRPVQASLGLAREPVFTAAEPSLAAPRPDAGLRAARYAGSLFLTYLVHEDGDDCVLVDQHAAHERVRYEELRRAFARATAAGDRPQAQELLLPEVIRFPADQRSLLESRLTWLSRAGFDAEVFGEDTLLFRSVPAAWSTNALQPRLAGLVDRVLSLDAPAAGALDETVFEALASEACRSSVRAGDRLEDEEARALVRRLLECEHPWNCPHGRPTVVRVPRARFEEWFQRRV